MKEIFIARQPIIDRTGHIHGYELLFRHNFKNNAVPIACNTTATSRVLVNALNNFGTKSLLGDHFGFVNIDHSFMDTSLFRTIPAKQFVLEILENSLVSESFISKIVELKSEGFTFALDDMDLSEEMICRFEPIFPYLSYVKIDLFSTTKEIITEKIGIFKGFKNISLLAEKVESIEDFEYYKEMGFSYFQGYFYEKPTMFSGKKFDPTRKTLLEFSALLDTDSDINELESKLISCPHMVVNLLRYINSVGMGMREPIRSLRHGLMLLGRQCLKQWVLLFLYANATGSIFSEPILISALFRGHMMQLLSSKICSSTKQDQAFMIGMLSLFDALLGLPLKEILKDIDFHTNVKTALLQREGTLGKILDLTIAVDEENFSNITIYLDFLNLDEDMLAALTTESYNWANNFYAEHMAYDVQTEEKNQKNG
ncbi:MAG: EAL domain-containing protein [Sulfuricurvum sp.]|nr:EAL domain-containing protein [Sulfuricurvum sp.]